MDNGFFSEISELNFLLILLSRGIFVLRRVLLDKGDPFGAPARG